MNRVFARRACRDLLSPRVVTPTLVILVMMGLFSAQRLALWIKNKDSLEAVTSHEIGRAFTVGLRFDLWAAGAVAALPVLLLAIAGPGWICQRWFRRTACGLCAALLMGATFAAIADFYFFQEFDERLNHKALLYLDQPYTYAVIWKNYPVVPALAAAAVAFIATAWAVGRLAFRWPHPDQHPAVRLAVLAGQICVLALMFRGSLGPKPLNAGPAYFSDSSTLAQLALNPLFTLKESAVSMTMRGEDLRQALPVLAVPAALEEATRLIVRPTDRSLGDARNPLLRVSGAGKPQRDYNVVLVIMESFSWPYIEALGGMQGLAPNLSRLAQEGVLMDHCFAVGDRTTRGFSGIVCGFPDLPGRSVTTRIEAVGSFLTLGTVLANRGYDTMFVYAGQPMYDHRQSFLKSNGYGRMVFEHDFARKTFESELGWCDDDLFEEAARQCDALSAKPFMATLMTLSFHRPFDVPPGTPVFSGSTPGKTKQLTAVHYADAAIGRFIERARTAKWFDNTLFVFVADHAGGYLDHPLNEAAYRVPFLLYGPNILGEARRVTSVCSQTDVAPTIMGLLGGEYEHCFFGSSVLDRPAAAGLALMQQAGKLSLIDHDGVVVHVPFGGKPRLLQYTAPNDLRKLSLPDDKLQTKKAAMTRQAVALLQTANIVFERTAHRVIATQPSRASKARSAGKMMP